MDVILNRLRKLEEMARHEGTSAFWETVYCHNEQKSRDPDGRERLTDEEFETLREEHGGRLLLVNFVDAVQERDEDELFT
jgi:hypothetical protein